MNLSSLRFLRILGNVEGVSYLLLLGLAMPLKFSFALFLATLIPFGTFVTDRKIRALKNLVN